MFIGAFILDHQHYCNLYDTWQDWFSNTFNPQTIHEDLIELVARGRDYNERKNDVRDKAIQYSNTDTSGLSWAEFSFISGWFEAMGRRYGLLTEFRENGIC